MVKTNSAPSNVSLSLDTSTLTPAQIRIIRSIQSLLLTISTTENEDEYFDNSSELLKLFAHLIKQANFNGQSAHKNSIPYATQALELSLDNLAEDLQNNRLGVFDH